MRICRPITIFIALTLTYSAATFAEPVAGKNRYQIHINHAADAVSICRVCTKSKDYFAEMRLDERMPLALHPGDEVEIWIDDPNPLLFSYKIGPIEVFELESVAAARQFATYLGGFLGDLVPSTATATKTATAQAKAQASEDFLRDLGVAETRRATKTTSEKTRKEATARALDLQTSAEQINDAVKTLALLREQTATATRTAEDAAQEASRADLPPQEAVAAAVRQQTRALARDEARLREEQHVTELNRLVNEFAVRFGSPPSATVVIADTLDMQLADYDLSLELLTAMESDLKALQAKYDKIPELTLASVDSGARDELQKTVRDWQLAVALKNLTDSYDKVEAAHKKIAFADRGDGVDLIRRVRTSRADFQRVAQQLDTFARAVATLGEPTHVHMEGSEKILVMDYDALVGRRYPFVITALDHPDSYKSQIERAIANKRWQTGSFSFYNAPHHPVRFTAGPAVVYSLLKKKEYVADVATEGPDTGKLVVTKKPTERVTGAAIGMMLNIIPSGWDDPFFRPSFQIGLTAGKDTFGVCGGAGFSVSDIFSLGVGALVQRQDRLSNELHVGSVLQSADQLKLAKEYRVGAYFHVTYHIQTSGSK